MKIGLQIPRFDWSGSPQNIDAKLVEIAKTADDAGFSSLWVMEHFFQVVQGFGPPEAPVLEGYSTISYLAAVTQKIKVGLMVTGNINRHPGILVKTVTTLDVLSGGRAYLDIGTGGFKQEAKGTLFAVLLKCTFACQMHKMLLDLSDLLMSNRRAEKH